MSGWNEQRKPVCPRVGRMWSIKFPFAARTRIYETGVPYGAVGSEVGFDLVLLSP
jgi:hypothetical protein